MKLCLIATICSFVLLQPPAPRIDPGNHLPAPRTDTTKDNRPDITGDFMLQKSDGETIGVVARGRDGGIISYKTTVSLPPGTSFKIHGTVYTPEYVYIIWSDQTMQFYLKYPYGNGSKASLDNSINHITYPADNAWFRINMGSGTNYLGIICSKDELRISRVIDSINSQDDKDVAGRIKNALAGKLLDARSIWVDKDNVSTKGISSAERGVLVNIITYDCLERNN